jgi:hypothetical protein
MNKKEWTYIATWSKKIKAINLLGDKCYKCNEDKPWILDFHHNDPNQKEFNISHVKSYRWSIIEKEIKKCVLLCRNCHAELHNHVKDTRDTESKKIILNFKLVDGCEVCHYNKYNGSLDFHHKHDKQFTFNNIRIQEKSSDEFKQQIIQEINKCIVLCKNCHQDLHFDKMYFNKYKEQIYNYQVKEKQKPLDKQKVINMFNSGMKQIDIAKELNCAKSTVCQIIKNI